MDAIRRTVIAAAILTCTSLIAACAKPPTRDELDAAQIANDMADAVHDLRQSNADLRASMDSLSQVVARQDTLLRQVAVVAGVPVPAPGIPVRPSEK